MRLHSVQDRAAKRNAFAIQTGCRIDRICFSSVQALAIFIDLTTAMKISSPLADALASVPDK